ncbi:MAG: hypothetical protein ABIN37_04885, partial [Burkholderiaceae bacterium]
AQPAGTPVPQLPTAPRLFAFGLTRCACHQPSKDNRIHKGDISLLDKRGHYNFALTEKTRYAGERAGF